tara:strand:- start:221 stop:514 length:294 start_codon:yes stop_codon:yes gene_type:complete
MKYNKKTWKQIDSLVNQHAKNLREPKADYFRRRYMEAIEDNLKDIASYYEQRLIDMNEPTYISDDGEMKVKAKKLGKITQHNIQFNEDDNKMRIYSF